MARGGFGSELALHLALRGAMPAKFDHLCARAHQYERYGSQVWLRAQSGLDAAALLAVLAS